MTTRSKARDAVIFMSVVIVVLLVRTFEREMGLRPAEAALASLPFVLPSAGLAAVAGGRV